MASPFPFDIPEALRLKLPPPSRDGYIYADVKFRGVWDGILVVNTQHQCIGVYCGRRVKEWRLSFTPDQIEDLRRPCLMNRVVAALPEGLDAYGCAVLAIWIACPVLLLVGFTLIRWVLLFCLPLVVFCVGVMYTVRGFPLTRFPTALAGLVFALAASIGLASSLFF